MHFSEGMHQIVLQCFPYADITLDRFHMQQLVSDAMQELRLKHKKEAQKAQNEQRKEFKAIRKKCFKLRKKDKKSKRGRKPFRKNKAFIPERLSNGDTVPELLGRCRYSLMVPGDKWTSTQKERMKLVFERYPDLEEAYSIVHSIRIIFSNPRATWISGYESIQKWYEKVRAFGNDAFITAADTIHDREDEVLNYFLNRATNASAESLNSKIKQFRAQLRGVIDVDFFLYRLSMIYG
jgi:transposase